MAATFSSDDLRQLASRHFQLSLSDVCPLDGEVDLNYRLTTTDADRYTLKISQAGQNAAAIRFQYELLHHLAGKDLPFATPRPVGNIVELPDGSLLRLLSWVPGRMLGNLKPITAELRQSWGATAGHLTAALLDFRHADAPTSFRWNPSQTLDCRPLTKHMTTAQAQLANFYWDRFERDTLPHLASLPQSVNYNDAHQHNLLVDDSGGISGLIDFGDAMYTHTINELAIACAYAAMDVHDPLGAMADVVTGYLGVSLLPVAALPHLLNLTIGRLLITVSQAAKNHQLAPDNEYLQVSVEPAWAVLEKLRSVPPRLAEVGFGHQAGYLDHWDSGKLEYRIFPTTHAVIDLTNKKTIRLDLSVGSLDLGNNANFENPTRFARQISRHLEDHDADFAVGGYGETRPIYTTDDYATEGNDGPRWRTVHLGVDVWGPAGTAIYAPLDGIVHSIGIDPTNYGYGHVIILQHATGSQAFYTLYGHLAAPKKNHPLSPGTPVKGGDLIATLGEANENGGWPPHLHFQVMRDLLGYSSDFPGVAYPEQANAWLSLCPDPLPFLHLTDPQIAYPLSNIPYRLSPTPASYITAVTPPTQIKNQESLPLLPSRKTHLGYSLSLSYKRPLTILRGARQYLYDHTGRRFLDTVNNVAHVGHEHPAVVAAIQRQAAVLNTNSRYLHPNVVHFAEELVATMPEQLSVVHFVNSGSEANELALRMCEQWSATRNMLAVEVGYHGNTGRTIDVSGYKFDGKGGHGAPPQTRLLPLPDLFRGIHRGHPETAGVTYGAYAKRIIADWQTEGQKVGGFIAESILSCGGQIVLPDGYLAEVYRHVRAAGGLCIADEVQVGLGRVGSHWWGFELQGVVPDIVTIGKPLGNGHPLAAVVCTPEVAANFANGMEFFNTFGGNPVSCAAGRAVLQVVKDEGLMEHATAVGSHLTTLLGQLKDQHPIIGDVRGKGLFLGFELMAPAQPSSLAPFSAHSAQFDRLSASPAAAPKSLISPATRQANYLKNRMRDLGFLMSTDGPDENVLKIKPPMCFNQANAEQLVDYLDRVLGEDGSKG